MGEAPHRPASWPLRDKPSPARLGDSRGPLVSLLTLEMAGGCGPGGRGNGRRREVERSQSQGPGPGAGRAGSSRDAGPGEQGPAGAPPSDRGSPGPALMPLLVVGSTAPPPPSIRRRPGLPEAGGGMLRASGLLGVRRVPALQVTQVNGLEGLQTRVRDLLHILLHQAPLAA